MDLVMYGKIKGYSLLKTLKQRTNSPIKKVTGEIRRRLGKETLGNRVNRDLKSILKDLKHEHYFKREIDEHAFENKDSLVEVQTFTYLESLRRIYYSGGHRDIANYGLLSEEMQAETKKTYDEICFLLYPDDIHEHFKYNALAFEVRAIRD